MPVASTRMLRIAAFPKQNMSALDRKWITSRCVNQNAA